jgi:protein ImuA
VAALRRRIAAIEDGPARAWRGAAPLTLGVPAIEDWLPGGGLARGGLHEVLGPRRQAGHDAGAGAALAFAAVLAARRAALGAFNLHNQGGGHVLWCAAPRRWGTELYGPGLAAFGLDAARLILVRGRDEQQRLWAMEEGLKCSGLAMVVGEVGRLDLGQGRRLQLAAEASGVTALLLHAKGDDAQGITGALTRWRITSRPSAPSRGYVGIGAPRCRVELLRCKGGRPGEWLLQWNGAGFEDQRNGEQRQPKRQTDSVPVAAALADGPAAPRPISQPMPQPMPQPMRNRAAGV